MRVERAFAKRQQLLQNFVAVLANELLKVAIR